MPQLTWIGRSAVEKHHRDVPVHLLKEVETVGPDAGGNLLVQGDNLLALKALLPHYKEKVACVYIDPPYNTGEEGWKYNDNVTSPEMRTWLGNVVGKESEDLSRHDKWLCMMYPRLVLLRELLHPEHGSIWISIDDNEIHNLRALMDEIFGRERFVACNVWQKRYSRENREAIGDVHEYVLTYAMNLDKFKKYRNRVPLDADSLAVYKNPNNDPKGPWQSISFTAQGYRPNQMYTITAPKTLKTHQPPPGRCWGYVEAEWRRFESEGRMWYGADGNGVPRMIRYLTEVDGLVPWTWWPHEDVGHTDEAKKEIMSLLDGEVPFDTPKPVRLIDRIITIASKPGDLILDSFAGSGTTGHAVLAANARAADKPSRRFILVEIVESICNDVTKTRLQRVATGHVARGIQPLGGGFSVNVLGKPLFDAAGHITTGVKFTDLARYAYVAATGRALAGRVPTSPLLGTENGTAVYLLFNGILGDTRPKGGNVLTWPVYNRLPKHHGPKIIYGEASAINNAALKTLGVEFRKIPHELAGTV